MLRARDFPSRSRTHRHGSQLPTRSLPPRPGRHHRGRHHRAVAAGAADAPDAGEAAGLRIGHASLGRRPRAILRQVLHGRDAVHRVRHRNRVHDSVGRVLPAALLPRAAGRRRLPASQISFFGLGEMLVFMGISLPASPTSGRGYLADALPVNSMGSR